MGEFQTPFNTIVTRDIKHIYSGFPNNVHLRYTPQYPTMEQLKIREENTELKAGVLRFSEYDEKYGCLIPRAPAFRTLSQQEIEEMVQRLQKPTIASKGICNTSDKNVVEHQDMHNPKYRGTRKVDAAEIPGITERLTRHTEISKIRKHQTATKLAQMTEISI